MLSRFAKLLFVATSLAPALGAITLLRITEGASGWDAWQFVFYGGILWLICILVIAGAWMYGEREPLTYATARVVDQETLALLIAYLLPIATVQVDVTERAIVLAYMFGVLGIAIYHSNAFFFNPLLGMVGFHFYQIEVKGGLHGVLITKGTIRKPSGDRQVVKLFEGTYLDLGAPE